MEQQLKIAQNKKSKWLIPAIIVVGIIFLGAGTWAGYNHWVKSRNFQPPQEPGDNELSAFKIYRSELGYEIKYPPTWAYLTCMDGVQFSLYSSEDKIENCDEPRGYNSEISIIGPSSPPGNINDAREQKEIMINGVKATRYIDASYGQDIDSGLFRDMIVISENGRTFTIDLAISTANSALLDLIVSTFKFFEPKQGFCGQSTNGSCSKDSDCMAGGCSGQVCQSKSEEPVITTCEYTDCYNPATYNLTCGCKDNQCQWK
jgi:eight-cysteine-cluster-containing protein